MKTPDPTGAPGAELVVPGLRDLLECRETTEALLVAVGASRLRELGFDVPPVPPAPEHCFYDHLAQREGHNAHAAYNALIRRLVSFERAMEARRSALVARGPGRVLRARRDGRFLPGGDRGLTET
jgi:hypothetical protein